MKRKILSAEEYYKKLSKKDKDYLHEVEKYTLALMQEYGVGHFKFKWRKSKKFLGNCSVDTIGLEIRYALHCNEVQIKNTILHEIAHALVGYENGHNIIWQNKAKEIGVTWTRNYRK